MTTRAPLLLVFQSQVTVCGVSVCMPSFPVRPGQDGPNLTMLCSPPNRPADHVSLDFYSAFDLCQLSHPAPHPAICSWSLPFLPSLSIGSPTHSLHGERLLVFHRVSSLPLSPSHFPRTFLSRHVPSPVT